MPGRPPAAPGQRRRRNADAPQWVTLSTDTKHTIPPVPESIRHMEQAVEWWERVWKDPMAAVYLPSDHLALERAAKLHHLIINGHPRVAQDGTEVWEPGSPAEMAELRQIEDRFGLNPKSRRLLQWEVAQAGDKTEQPAAQRPTKARTLRAVDSA